MVKVFKYGQMVPNMMATGMKVKYRARVFYFIVTEMLLKENFMKIKLTDMLNSQKIWA